uniref:CSD domain-containing protein n=1 Tax=Alexandrium monilatum TaxID=311494 RepID=A0A7S4SD49_9DINO
MAQAPTARPRPPLAPGHELAMAAPRPPAAAAWPAAGLAWPATERGGAASTAAPMLPAAQPTPTPLPGAVPGCAAQMLVPPPMFSPMAGTGQAAQFTQMAQMQMQMQAAAMMQMQMGAMAQMQMAGMMPMMQMAMPMTSMMPMVQIHPGGEAQAVEEDLGPCTPEDITEVELELKDEEKAAKIDAKKSGSYVGLMARYIDDEGFGFISCPECKETWDKTDIFVSGRNFVTSGIDVGDVVAFQVEKDGKDLPRAVNCKTLMKLTNLKKRITKMREVAKAAHSLKRGAAAFGPGPGPDPKRANLGMGLGFS